MNAKLEGKISTLARRYLGRIGHQRHDLIEAVNNLKNGEFCRLADIFDLTHQITDAAGTFGFPAISHAAGEINTFVLNLEPDEMHLHFSSLDILVIDFDNTVTNALRRHPAGQPSRRRADARRTPQLGSDQPPVARAWRWRD